MYSCVTRWLTGFAHHKPIKRYTINYRTHSRVKKPFDVPSPAPKTRRCTTSVRATARAGPTSTAQTGIICGRGRIAAAQGQKPAPKLNSSFTTHQHVQTQSRTHEGPHLVQEQSNTPASFSCSRGGTYRAHRHGSESPYPGSTPGLNPCNHLA